MEVISINQLRIALGKLALSNKFVNDFFWGDIDSMRAWKERIAQYPLVTAYTTGVQVNRNTKIVTINLEVSDKMYKDWNKNLNEIESDTAQILEDLFNAMRKMPEWQKVAIVENDTFSATKFINKTGDVVAGWRASVSLKLSKKVGLCDSPFSEIAPLPPVVCADGTVRNSDGSYLDTVASGGILDLPDITVTDFDGSTRQVPSVTNVVCIVPPPCLDGTVIITDNNDNVIGTQEVESGGVATYKVVDLPCAVDEKSWVIQFIDQVEEIQMLANIGNIATFTSGSGADIGTLSVSTDGTNFAPISYPFTPVVGRYWFRRSAFLVSAEYKMIE